MVAVVEGTFYFGDCRTYIIGAETALPYLPRVPMQIAPELLSDFSPEVLKLFRPRCCVFMGVNLLENGCLDSNLVSRL